VSINFEFGEYASIQTGAHELGHKYVENVPTSNNIAQKVADES